MKCLLLAPMRYPFIHSIVSGMEAQGLELKAVDYESFFPPRTNRRYNNYTTLPRRIRKYWEEPYVQKTNESYLQIFREFAPDLVFIYNNQLVQPGLLEEFKKKARIAFMLGDNPLYTPTSIYNLHILFQADYIISPDSLWRDQLSRLGVPNVVFDSFGFNSALYHPLEVDETLRAEYQSDFIYVGSASKTNWGYKRALFLSLFKEFDFRAYISGGGMGRWYDLFPGLEEKVIPHDRFDAGFNNLVYNCSKIAPVEQVPSLFNGIHVRVFDVLGAGILPLCEESADLEQVFEGIDIPLIRDYREAPELAAHWLRHEDERKACVASMRQRVEERYAPSLVIERMIKQVF
ncbi:MAG: glycosyltransferase [Lewinellaceae bacterium]|nr:glycosyltransferase [Lewinellaceae bacterium]